MQVCHSAKFIPAHYLTNYRSYTRFVLHCDINNWWVVGSLPISVLQAIGAMQSLLHSLSQYGSVSHLKYWDDKNLFWHFNIHVFNLATCWNVWISFLYFVIFYFIVSPFYNLYWFYSIGDFIGKVLCVLPRFSSLSSASGLPCSWFDSIESTSDTWAS